MPGQQSAKSLDVRSLPGTSETLIYADGGLFPVVVTVPSGALIAVLRGGAGHHGVRGRLEAMRSVDAGRSWTPPMVVVDSERDDRNPAVGVTSTGTIILAYQRKGIYDESGACRPDLFPHPHPIDIMITRSTDAGLTWEEPFPLQVESLRTGSPFGKIVELPDGTMLLPIYGPSRAESLAGQTGVNDFASYIVRSHDGGKSWSDPTLIAPGMNETGILLLPGGDLLAVLRDNGPTAGLWSSFSSNGGADWSPPAQITGSYQHPADIVLLGDGSVLLTYGNRNPPYRIEGLISRDGGRSWGNRRLIFSAPLYGCDSLARRRIDLGYPSTTLAPVEQGRRGVTLYYYNPDIPRATDLVRKGPGARPDGPYYQARGYRAVAVTWDEAELIDALNQ